MNPKDEARTNLERMRANPYPGRGLSIGLDEAGKRIYQAYWIMGRSANSRNRVFVAEGATLQTAAADPSQMKEPSLVIYNAMRELPLVYIVTNGDQTDTIAGTVVGGGTFPEALATRVYEPDAPSFTPRISAMTDLREGRHLTQLAILRKSAFSAAADRFYFQYETLPMGAGYTITTYLGDGDPLPSFAGEPYLLPLAGTPRQAADTLWGALNEANRVSLAVKAIDITSGRSEITVINANKQTA